MINVFCRDNKWLFDDLKNEIASHGAVASQQPLPNADAWICVRSSEWESVPDKSRCLMQIHDVKNKAPLGFGNYSFVHEYQKKQTGLNGFVRPIGSRDVEYDVLPPEPTIGFFCREYGDLKQSQMFYEAVTLAKREVKFKVLMIGGNLSPISKAGKYERRGATPKDYSRIDALVTCSKSPMIPISCYEALSAGRAVISTSREWGFSTPMIKTGEDAEDIAELIIESVIDRQLYKPFTPYTREHWAKKQVEEAIKLCR